MAPHGVLDVVAAETQYTSAQFVAHLSKHNVLGSMGRTGQYRDDAMAESFIAALKNELIYRTAFPTRESARRAIAEYIEVFDNRLDVTSESATEHSMKSRSSTTRNN
jgi:transposase InsO family protein